MKRLHVAVACLLCVVIILGACSAPMPAPAAAGDTRPPPPPMEHFEDAMMEAEGNYFAMPIITPSDESGRLMVYNVNMRLQTGEFMSGWSLILRTVDEMGGYFPHRVFQGDDARRAPSGSRQAYFLFRLPTENLAQFIELVANNYNIWWLEITAQDETITYQRIDSALQELQEMERWLMELLEDAQTTEEIDEILDEILEILGLQEELAQVRRQIAEAEITQGQLMDDIIYSTVVIDLFEVSQAVPLTFGERLSGAVSGSMSAAASVVQGFAVFIVLMVPVVLVLAICVGLVFLVIRVINKMRRSKKLASYLNGEKLRGESPDKPDK